MKEGMNINAKIILLAIAALTLVSAVIAGSSNVAFTAAVTGTSNIAVTLDNGTFGSCTPGTSCNDITSAVHFYNYGNADPNSAVEAKFTTNISASYGLNTTSGDFINGSNFQLNNTAMATTDTPTELFPAAEIGSLVNVTVNAKLAIPAGTASGTYGGTLLISWTT